MKTIEYRTMDKSAWGPGPWQDEPDKIQFADPETGLPCLIRRTHHGHLCGYVGVPPGHPRHGCTEVDDLEAHGTVNSLSFCDDRDEAASICHVPDPGDPDGVFWLGFDCGHLGDVSPATNARMKQMYGVDEMIDEEAVYRDIEYVKAECARLAKQLAAEMKPGLVIPEAP